MNPTTNQPDHNPTNSRRARLLLSQILAQTSNHRFPEDRRIICQMDNSALRFAIQEG